MPYLFQCSQPHFKNDGIMMSILWMMSILCFQRWSNPTQSPNQQSKQQSQDLNPGVNDSEVKQLADSLSGDTRNSQMQSVKTVFDEMPKYSSFGDKWWWFSKPDWYLFFSEPWGTFKRKGLSFTIEMKVYKSPELYTIRKLSDRVCRMDRQENSWGNAYSVKTCIS